MKRLVAWTALVFVGWLTLSVAWAAAARLTGAPGPATAAGASIGAAAEAIESAHLPPPLSVSQRALTRRMRAGGRALARLYSVPELIAARLVGSWRGHGFEIEELTERLLDRDRRVRIEVAPERLPERPELRLWIEIPEVPAARIGERAGQRTEGADVRMDRVRQRVERAYERLDRTRDRLDRARERVEARIIQVAPRG